MGRIMSGLLYQASFENVSMGAATDNILQLSLGTAAIAIHIIKLTCGIETDTKLRLIIRETAGSAPTGGTALTEIPLQRRNAVAAQSSATVDSTGGGNGDDYVEIYWHRLSPFVYHPSPESRILLDSSISDLVVKIEAGSSDQVMSGSIIWEEF